MSAPADDLMAQKSLGQFRAELHDRILAGLYPFAFVALAFAFLGPPRTTRQGRNFAVSVLILVVLVVRIGGYACSTIAVSSPVAILIQYGLLAAVGGVSCWMILKGIVVDPPSGVATRLGQFFKRLPSWRRR